HLHLEQCLDRLADLDLVRARVHAEDDLVAQLVHQRALLRDHRAQHDVGGVHAAPPAFAASRATTRSMASRLRTRLTGPSTSETLRAWATSTLRRGRLRAARRTASSRVPSTTRVLPSSPNPCSHSTMRFVFASGSESTSTTCSLPSACRAASAARNAACRAER